MFDILEKIFEKDKEFQNKGKFDEFAQKEFKCNYEDLEKEAKAYITKKLIHESNRVFCEFCGSEDHSNEGKCESCGAVIAKRVDEKIHWHDGNLIDFEGDNNTIIQNNNDSTINVIRGSGNGNVVIQGSNSSSISINVNR